MSGTRREAAASAEPKGTTIIKITDQPELSVAVFAFLLNYPWEFLQVPLYLGMPEASHWAAIKIWTRATVGDAMIMLVSFGIVAAATRTRWWVVRPGARRVVGFTAAGVLITIVLERFAGRSDHPAWGWRYGEAMPIMPLIGVGLSPLMQWIVIPPLVAWFVKRQLGHLGRADLSGKSEAT